MTNNQKPKKRYDFLSDYENALIAKKQSTLAVEELELFFKIKQKILNKQKRNILARKAIAETKKDPIKTKINHAKFIFAGEVLKTENGLIFLRKLAQSSAFSELDAEALNLLANEYGLNLSFPIRGVEP